MNKPLLILSTLVAYSPYVHNNIYKSNSEAIIKEAILKEPVARNTTTSNRFITIEILKDYRSSNGKAETNNPPKCEHIDKKEKLADTTSSEATSIKPDVTISGGNSASSSPEMTNEVDGEGRYEEGVFGGL